MSARSERLACGGQMPSAKHGHDKGCDAAHGQAPEIHQRHQRAVGTRSQAARRRRTPAVFEVLGWLVCQRFSSAVMVRWCMAGVTWL